MRILSSGFFHESKVPRPKSKPLKYFRNFLVFVEIFTKKGFFVVISAMQYPEVAKPPGIITQRLHNLRVMIPEDCATFGYPNLDILQPPGNNTRKLLEKTYMNKLNENMAKLKKISEYGCAMCILRVSLPGRCTTSGNSYLEVRLNF